MFEKLIALENNFRIKAQNEVFSLPLRALVNASKLIQMVVDEQKIDDNKNNPFITKKGTNDKEYNLRGLLRVSSYTITIHNMEIIFYEFAGQLISYLYQYENIKFKEFKKERKIEISNYEWYRHKLFAHPAYAYKKKEDSETLRLTLLHYYAGEFIGAQPNGFSIGGTKIPYGQEYLNMERWEKHLLSEAEFIKSITKDFPPRVNIVENNDSILEHINNWERYLCELFVIFLSQ